MIPTRRLLAGAAAALACVLAASGCDTSPVAASVNSQKIKQTTLNAEVRVYSENRAYVTAFDESNEPSGITVEGDAPGTYSTHFVASVLDDEIVAVALHQYLAAHHDLPGPALVAAVRGWEAANYGSTWVGFPAWFRAELAERDALQAQFVTVKKSTASLRKDVRSNSGYLFSRVCVRQIGFSAQDAAGQVDYPQALSAAKAGAAKGTLSGGAVSCYTPVQLEAQGESFYQTVVSLGVGKVSSPQRAPFGYQVYSVTERAPLPFDAAMQRATTLVENANAGQSATTQEQQILSAARVHLDPQYGTWSPKTGVTPPVVKTTGS